MRPLGRGHTLELLRRSACPGGWGPGACLGCGRSFTRAPMHAGPTHSTACDRLPMRSCSARTTPCATGLNMAVTITYMHSRGRTQICACILELQRNCSIYLDAEHQVRALTLLVLSALVQYSDASSQEQMLRGLPSAHQTLLPNSLKFEHAPSLVC